MRLRGTLIDRIMTSLSKKVPEGFLTARYYPPVCFRVRWIIEFQLWGRPKGQLISKGVLMSSISSKKRTKEFDFTTMIPQIDLFSFVFWRKSKTPKNHFEIIWPLVHNNCGARKWVMFPFLVLKIQALFKGGWNKINLDWVSREYDKKGSPLLFIKSMVMASFIWSAIPQRKMWQK